MLHPDVKEFFDHDTFTWSYIVYSKNSNNKKCAIIDSVLGYDISSGRTNTKSADLIINFIEENGLDLEWILETHIHADHLTAAQYIKSKLGGKTAISKHIIKVLKTWIPILNIQDDTPDDGSQFDHIFEDDELFNIGDLKAQVIHTPGHTPADTSYIIGNSIFVGDAMFLPDVGTGRCDFPDGSSRDSYISSQKLLSLPDDYIMYVGHDYPPAGRSPESNATIIEQKTENIRINKLITKDEYITKRDSDDKGKPVPKLLLPSIQVNLRAGDFGKKSNGTQYIKIPIDMV